MPTPRQKTERFFSRFKSVALAPKTTLIREGETFQYVYFLSRGHIRMSATLSNGEEITLHIFEPGSFFPMMWVLNDTANVYSYQSIEACTLQFAPVDKFKTFLSRNPDVVMDLAKRAFAAISGLLYRLELLAEGAAEPKVEAALDYLVRHFCPDSDCKDPKVTFTHADIAKIAALARETTTTHINRLAKTKMIPCQNRLFHTHSPSA